MNLSLVTELRIKVIDAHQANFEMSQQHHQMMSS